MAEGKTKKGGRVIEMPPPVYSKVTESFLEDCLESGILFMKPEPSWGPRIPETWNGVMERFQNDSGEFAKADMDELRVYLTAMFQFASVMPQLMLFEFQNGNMVRALRRMRALLEEGSL